MKIHARICLFLAFCFLQRVLGQDVTIDITPPFPVAGDIVIINCAGSTATNIIKVETEKSKFGATFVTDAKIYIGLLTIVDQWKTGDTLGLLPPGEYTYTIRATIYESTFQGTFIPGPTRSYSRTFVVSPVTLVQDDFTPNETCLVQNYPNPFNPATSISFALASESFVSLKVFDPLAREVSILLSEQLPAGTYSRRWSAAGLPSGVYFYRLQAGDFVETKRMLLLK